MHYYQFNVADYRKSTQYLSFLEHAIYRALIDTYYLDESPLCGDDAKLMRMHSVRTDDEISAFKVVIEDFFTLKDDGYHHDKCDEVLSKIYEKSEKARASANKRWERNANASETHDERNANGMLPNTQYLDTQIPKEKNSKPIGINTELLESISNSWNESMSQWSPKINLTDKTKINIKRISKIKTILADHKDYLQADFWAGHINQLATHNDFSWQREHKQLNFDQAIQLDKFERNLGIMRMGK